MNPDYLTGARPPHPYWERLGIVAFARWLVSTKGGGVQTATGREACLERAALTFTGSHAAAVAFVARHRDELLNELEEYPSEPHCGTCTAPMLPTRACRPLGTWGPVWKCNRCGAVASR